MRELGRNWAEWSGILLIAFIIAVLSLTGCSTRATERPAATPKPAAVVQRGQINIPEEEKPIEPSAGAFRSVFDGGWRSKCLKSENPRFAWVKIETHFDRDVLKTVRYYYAKTTAPFNCETTKPSSWKTIYERMIQLKLIEDGEYKIYFSKNEKEFKRTFHIYSEGILFWAEEGARLDRIPAQ